MTEIDRDSDNEGKPLIAAYHTWLSTESAQKTFQNLKIQDQNQKRVSAIWDAFREWVIQDNEKNENTLKLVNDSARDGRAWRFLQPELKETNQKINELSSAPLPWDTALQWLQRQYKQFIASNPADKGIQAFESWINTQSDGVKNTFNAAKKVVTDARKTLADVLESGGKGLWDTVKGMFSQLFSNWGGIAGSAGGSIGGFWLGNMIGNAVAGPVLGFIFGIIAAVIGLFVGGGVGKKAHDSMNGGAAQPRTESNIPVIQQGKALSNPTVSFAKGDKIGVPLTADGALDVSRVDGQFTLKLEHMENGNPVYRIIRVANKTVSMDVSGETTALLHAKDGKIDLASEEVVKAFQEVGSIFRSHYQDQSPAQPGTTPAPLQTPPRKNAPATGGHGRGGSSSRPRPNPAPLPNLQ